MGYSSVIVEAIFTIASIIAASVFATLLVGKMNEFHDIFALTVKSKIQNMKINIAITYAAYDDSQGFFLVYAKNIGKKTIVALPSADLYFGTLGSAKLYMYDGDGIFSPGEWRFEESTNPDNYWSPGETIIFKIYNETSIDPPYYVKIVLPEGSYAEETFSIIPR